MEGLQEEELSKNWAIYLYMQNSGILIDTMLKILCRAFTCTDLVGQRIESWVHDNRSSSHARRTLPGHGLPLCVEPIERPMHAKVFRWQESSYLCMSWKSKYICRLVPVDIGIHKQMNDSWIPEFIREQNAEFVSK